MLKSICLNNVNTIQYKTTIYFNSAFQTRSRVPLILSAHMGRLCPEPLIQSRPCPYTECYYWLLSEWTQCHIEVRKSILSNNAYSFYSFLKFAFPNTKSCSHNYYPSPSHQCIIVLSMCSQQDVDMEHNYVTGNVDLMNTAYWKTSIVPASREHIK